MNIISEMLARRISDQEVRTLERQVESLKLQIANMRRQESDMMRDHEDELERTCKRHGEIVKGLNSKLEDSEFRIQQLTNSISRRMFKSLLEKLENVSKRLDLTETVLKNTERMLQDEIGKRDKMRKFIDTLPESYRAAWSVILMKDQEGSDENQSK